MATTLPVQHSRAIIVRDPLGPARSRRSETPQIGKLTVKNDGWWFGVASAPSRRALSTVLLAGSRADDSARFEMSVENALKVLGVSEGASFDDILRAKNSTLAACKDDQEAIAQVPEDQAYYFPSMVGTQDSMYVPVPHDEAYYFPSMVGTEGNMSVPVEAAYDMLLMQSLSQRRAGKVVSSSIRYADVKPVNAPGMGSMPQWLQATVKNPLISIETPSNGDLGIQVGVYGALMALSYVNGASTFSTAPYASADVPGLILATSFGASLYFMTGKNVKLGKATVITIGGLVTGAVVGSVVENWLQVDIVPFLGIHSPAVVVSEFILLSQCLVSLYLR